jgi:CCR4-NOT transcription complex subunit 9
VRRVPISWEERRDAVHVLAGRRDLSPEIASRLWSCPGAVASMLGDIFSVYPFLASDSIVTSLATEICDILVLFQFIASCDDTRLPLVRASVPVYMFPFLEGSPAPFRLATLGVYAELIRAGQLDVFRFLLKIDFVPMLLKVIGNCDATTLTIALYVLHRILVVEIVRNSVFESQERIIRIVGVLNSVLQQLIATPAAPAERLFVKCYEAFLSLPEVAPFVSALRSDVISCESNLPEFAWVVERMRAPRPS